MKKEKEWDFISFIGIIIFSCIPTAIIGLIVNKTKIWGIIIAIVWLLSCVFLGLYQARLTNSKFNLFIRKYRVFKFLCFSFLALFVLQHSVLTEAPQCWLPIEENGLISKMEKVNADFIYTSICKNICFFEKKVIRKEYPYCSTQIIIQSCRAKPHFIDSERLYLIGALKDFRTIFLFGFLFDYDRLLDDLENNLEI